MSLETFWIKICIRYMTQQEGKDMIFGMFHKGGTTMRVYNKLVRDKIPEIIKADGKECKTRILSNDEYIAVLEAKLNEEVAEYQADKNLEEMADVLEVLQAICIARGYSLEELEALRAKKASERGGFADKIFLEYVE